MTFVERIAEYIHEQELPLENLTIVLPSERAKKYIAEALYTVYQRPVFAPEMVTIDRWVKSYSSFGVIDSTRALLKLFEIQLNSAKTEIDESFDEFLAWGTTLLSDFNEIDRYLLDAKQVFRNLADIKEIENWSFGEEKLSESQQRFMEFWDRLPGYYYALNELLTKKEVCYAGKAFRELAMNLNRLFEKNERAVYLFAGFNALSKSELSIIKQLDQLGRAHVLIDADAYYYNDSVHEAGKFLRVLSKELDGKKLPFVYDELSTKKMNVQLISCAQKTGQAKVAATVLESLTKEQMNETLLLLADETLINSVIKNLPKNVGKANITLGLPIRNTAIRTWVELLFSIQENAKRFRTNATYFYDLQAFWNHPFILAALDEAEKKKLLQLERELIKRNAIFVNHEKLALGENAMELLKDLVVPWKDWNTAMAQIRSLNKRIYKQLDSTFAFEKAALEAFDFSLIDFENILSEGIPTMSLKSFKQLFNQHWGTKSIAYHGNPLDGLQIMGLLETRALDFKRIICVGMNEGQLPPTNPVQTMIPMDLRRFLGLPTPREKQGLFAHHFYRLLHHCEELIVTFCSADETIGSNEPSRYLMQLEMELSRLNRNISIEKMVYSLEMNQQKSYKEIPKSPEILERMDELFAQSTSASMLKKYISCPLDFYFRYVMEFGEEESIEEEIEHSTFGTFIHDTLEELYTPFARFDKQGNQVVPAPSNITSLDIDRMIANFRVVLTDKFMKHFNNDRNAFTKGKNLLSYKMAQELTERFLKSEKAFLEKQTVPVFIEALEREYATEIDVSVHGQTKKVNLRGFVDRIDSIGDRIRIVDYKTGKVNEEDVKFKSRGADTEAVILDSLKTRKHTLQLLMYSFLYQQQHGVIAEASIISFVSNGNEPFSLDTGGLPLDELVTEFPQWIGKLMEEMYDEEVPFKHNDAQYFSYCDYCE